MFKEINLLLNVNNKLTYFNGDYFKWEVYFALRSKIIYLIGYESIKFHAN
jgi:hypothetical protein